MPPPASSSQLLRAQALELLQQAMQMDCMGPYMVTHFTANGMKQYILWSPGMPSVSLAVRRLEIDFHPEWNETVTIEPTFSLEDFTCQYENRMISELDLAMDDGDADGSQAVDRPRG